MRPVDLFFHSLRDAFRPSDSGPLWLLVVLGGSLISAAGWYLFRRYSRSRSERASFARFVNGSHLAPGEADLIQRLAQQVNTSPLLVATHIDEFERATAAELAQHAPTGRDQRIFARLHQLRHALGFHLLAEHFPLLTTRELDAGMAIEVAGIGAKVLEVGEACFVVGAPPEMRLPTAAERRAMPLTVTHRHEARYSARCALLTIEPAPDMMKMVFAHDEHPARIQLRAAVRVAIGGPIALRPWTTAGSGQQSHETSSEGNLLDVSIGGMALVTKAKLAVGSAVRATFQLDGHDYSDVGAWVLACKPLSRSAFHLRLQFRGLSSVHETELAAALARKTAKPSG